MTWWLWWVETAKGKLADRMLETALNQLSTWAKAFVRVAMGESSVKSCRITVVGADAISFCDAVLAGKEAGVRLVSLYARSGPISANHQHGDPYHSLLTTANDDHPCCFRRAFWPGMLRVFWVLGTLIP